MSMHPGYLVGTFIFAVIFIIAVTAQSKAQHFQPLLYWATIIATTTVGTTLADFADRSLGIGYAGGSIDIWWLVSVAGGRPLLVQPFPHMFFWIAFVLTRLLGAVVGDVLDKPDSAGGLALSRYSTSIALFAGIAILLFSVPQCAAQQSH